MNMKAASPHKGRLGAALTSLSLAGLLLGGALVLSAGAWAQEKGATAPPEASLQANDTMGQRFDRLFRPRTYWQAKVAELEARVESSRQNFVASDQAYREFLGKRRDAMRQARAVTPTQPGQPHLQRREVLLSYREESSRLRRLNREAQKSLRQEMMWLEYARRALEQSR